MKLQRASIVLTLILTLTLSLAAGCRSATVAQRFQRPGINRSTSVIATVPEHTAPKTEAAAAELAADDTEPVQQVSAETVTETVIPPIVDGDMTRLSIQAAIETGLAQNPDLVALRQAEGVGTAAVGVAQTYPFNPYVQVQATPYQENRNGGTGTTYHYILLIQQIQLGHQQQHREEAACAALNGIRWNVLQQELLNVAQTERLYFVAIYQQGLRDLAVLNAQNNRQLLAILESQYQAGQATAADLAIVRLDARSTRQQLRVADANLQTALLDLKRQLCLSPETRIVLAESVTRWKWQPVDATQLTSVATGRPDVLAARADTDTARANADLANSSRIPDLQIGPYYQRNDSGTTFVGFRAQMDLPVFNNGVPLLRQREAEFHQRATTAQQLATRAHLEAEAAADRYERARQLLSEPGDAPLPVELQRLEEQFKAGEVDILRLLQARTSLIQNQRADLDALNEMMQAAVAVTVASGAPLESLISTTEPEKPN
jgi:cobalt-zinc-cadmium efflux system outer membrane protein